MLLSILTMSHPLPISPRQDEQEGESVMPLTDSLLSHDKYYRKNVGVLYWSQMLYKYTGTKLGTITSIGFCYPRWTEFSLQ